MNQLLIIDVQIDYIEWVLSADLLQKIPDYAKEFDSIIYIWDNSNQSNLNDQLPDDWQNSYYLNENKEEVEIIGFGRKINFFLEKEYGFFRDLMNLEIPKKF